MGVIKVTGTGTHRGHAKAPLSDWRTAQGGPGPGLSLKRRPSDLGKASPPPDQAILNRRANIARDARTNKRQKPSMPRLPWDE